MARGEIADQIRDHLTNLVEAARRDGERHIKFRAGDVSKALKSLGAGNAQVCNVLTGKRFHDQARVKLLEDKTEGPPSGMGGNVVCHYEILELGTPASAPDNPQLPQPNPDTAASSPPADTPLPISSSPGRDAGERLARLEATIESLVREVRDAKADIRLLHSRIDSLHSEMRKDFGET